MERAPIRAHLYYLYDHISQSESCDFMLLWFIQDGTLHMQAAGGWGLGLGMVCSQSQAAEMQLLASETPVETHKVH